MATIDIGPGATNRALNSNTATYTMLDIGNAANDIGILDVFEFYFDINATGVKAGTFYGSNPNFTNRDYETIGAVTAGSKQTFSGLNCGVQTSDLIGFYCSSGTISFDSSGSGKYYKSGDQFGAGQQAYDVASGDQHSIYGTGITSAGFSKGFIIE